MKADIQANIANIQAQIAALKPASPPRSEVAEKKWNPEAHPAVRKSATGTPTPADEQKSVPVFKVGDTVSAKYKADKAFYPATIIEITGSATNPMYTVNFKGYSGKEIIRAYDIRPIASAAAAQKRKADGSPVTPTVSTPITSNPATANTGVISAAASINPDLALAARNQANKPLGGLEPKDKPAKKVKTNKALEKSKNNWQTWQNKAASGKVGKVANKESMFRTGQSETARGVFRLTIGHSIPFRLMREATY